MDQQSDHATIAYEGLDGNIHRLDLNGRMKVREHSTLTWDWSDARSEGGAPTAPAFSNILYQWPTWSPDGSHLLTTATWLDENEEEYGALMELSPDGERSIELFRTHEAPILYAHYARNGESVAALVSERGRLTLSTARRTHPGQRVDVMQGRPLFYDWTDDCGALVVHVGGRTLLAKQTNLMMIEADTGRILRDIGAAAAAFRVPAVHHGRIAFMRGENSSVRLLFENLDGTETTACGGLSGQNIISWRPAANGEIWCAHNPSDSEGPFHRLIRYRDGEDETVIFDRDFYAFFPFPCGRRLLVVRPGRLREETFSLSIYDLEHQGFCELGEYWPTPEERYRISFFDQYTLSHNPVAPDGRGILFSGHRYYGKTREKVSPHIYLIEPDGMMHELQEGRFAVWQPRLRSVTIPHEGL